MQTPKTAYSPLQNKDSKVMKSPTSNQCALIINMLLLLILAISGNHQFCAASTPNPFSIGIRSAIVSNGNNPFNSIRNTMQTRRQCRSIVDSEIQSDYDQAIERGGASVAVAAAPQRSLLFWENMLVGAISRSIAQTVMHPANTMKTILQANRAGSTTTSTGLTGGSTLSMLTRPKNLKLLTRGAGAQFILSVPHGAINFAVLELVRAKICAAVESVAFLDTVREAAAFGPSMDFLSSAISTICCSVVSTPQMMITDNIMAGTYPNLFVAVKSLSQEKGISGFYTGWWPGLAGKIPSYALTWTLFQQTKQAHRRIFDRDPNNIDNSIMGCIASGAAVCAMIPMDTIKTRLVTQLSYPDLIPYKGIVDCAMRVAKEEGVPALYRGLTPRLISVMPMMGIQFGVYEFMKKTMLDREVSMLERSERVKGLMMADDDVPHQAPLGGKTLRQINAMIGNRK